MKQFTIAILFFVSLVARSGAVTQCYTFPRARQADCGRLIDNHLGDGTAAPVVNGKAVISLGTCALVTQPVAGQAAVTRDCLARRGNKMYYACDSQETSGFVYSPESGEKRTCMMHRDAYVMVFLSPY